MKKSPAKIILLNFATNDARHFHFRDIEKDYRLARINIPGDDTADYYCP